MVKKFCQTLLKVGVAELVAPPAAYAPPSVGEDTVTEERERQGRSRKIQKIPDTCAKNFCMF